jgi:hypothetical protein
MMRAINKEAVRTRGLAVRARDRFEVTGDAVAVDVAKARIDKDDVEGWEGGIAGERIIQGQVGCGETSTRGRTASGGDGDRVRPVCGLGDLHTELGQRVLCDLAADTEGAGEQQGSASSEYDTSGHDEADAPVLVG